MKAAIDRAKREATVDGVAFRVIACTHTTLAGVVDDQWLRVVYRDSALDAKGDRERVGSIRRAGAVFAIETLHPKGRSEANRAVVEAMLLAIAEAWFADSKSAKDVDNER